MSKSDNDTGDHERLGLWGAVSIGVGGMVGGGIFAVLGLSVDLAAGGAPVAFALAGVVAALTATSYARLSVDHPSSGGTITFLNSAFGPGELSGGLNVLLWLSYVIMLALYASAFGNYFATTVVSGNPPWWLSHLALSGVVVTLTALNAASASAVGRAEEVLVIVKIVILVVFVAAGLTVVEPGRLAVGEWAPPLSLVGGGMLIFVAYEGFELIANAADDVEDAERVLPRAFAISVGGVALLYILVAVVTVGVLTLPEIRSAQDFALAEAARPRFGQAGFTVIGIAAVLSTASALNATLYGATRLTFSVARSGELPAPFARRLRGGVSEGLLITSALTLVLANTVALERISTAGSAGFLIIFCAVNIARVRLAGDGERSALAVIGAVACAVALAALLVQAATNDWVAAAMSVTLVGVAFGAELAYRRWRPARPQAQRPTPGA
ncbi:MAG: APC family permease [Acidimicrobiales bacterium]|nr:APC family permease [Acidimicrobiales bacterium]